jgi:hypothetical protein
MSDNNICSVYRNSPLLKGVRTEADLQAIDKYCNYAVNFNYGPNPTSVRVDQPVCNCPFGYGYNQNAYNFQSGPSMINLNQSLNYSKQQAMKQGFRGVPQGPSRY